MTTPNTRRRSRTALGLSAALGVAALTGTAPSPVAAAVADCRLVELPPPAGGFDAGVMDIEVVDGVAVYYGNYQVVEGDGVQHQRAVVWRGLDGAPLAQRSVGASGIVSVEIPLEAG